MTPVICKVVKAYPNQGKFAGFFYHLELECGHGVSVDRFQLKTDGAVEWGTTLPQPAEAECRECTRALLRASEAILDAVRGAP